MFLFPALALALLFRIPYYIFWDVFYNADYALIGLMGRHFMKGEISFYAWGAAYHANVEPLLMAPLFKAFGSSPQIASLLPIFFSLVFLVLFYFYLVRVCGLWTARAAVLLAAAPSPFFMATAVRNSDYPEIFCLGILHFLLFNRIISGDRRARNFWMLGLAAGFSWFYLKVIFIFWLALIFTLAVHALTPQRVRVLKEYFHAFAFSKVWREAILLKNVPISPVSRTLLSILNLYNLINFTLAVLLWFHGPWAKPFGKVVVKLDFWPLFQSSAQMAAASALLANWKAALAKAKESFQSPLGRGLIFGFLIGYSPALIGVAFGQKADSRNGLATAKELIRNLHLGARELLPQMAGVTDHSLLTGAAILIIALSMLYAAFMAFQIARRRWSENAPLPAWAPLIALAFANFLLGITYDRLIDPSTLRYFLPLWLVFPVALALGLEKLKSKARWLAWPILFLLLCNSAFANLKALAMHESPQPFEPVVERLRQKGIQGGYANYWIATYATFLSQEKIILAPVETVDRYPAYTEYVRNLDRLAWVGDYPVVSDGKVIVKDLSYDVTGQDLVGNVLILYLKKTAAR